MKNNNFISKINYNLLVAIIGISLFMCLSCIIGYQSSLLIGIIPIVLLSVGIALTKSWISLTFLFLTNYIIMGVTRYIYISIPITNVFDLIYGTIIAFIIIKQIYKHEDFSKVLNVYTIVTFIWLLYCTINIGNNVTGSIHFESCFAPLDH